MDKIQKKQAELQRIRDAKARWWRKLSRAVTAIDKLDAQERRLLKPRPLEAHEKDSGKEITGKDLHKIRDPEFFDDSKVLAQI
jgi:Ulp1 family protease